MRDICNCLFRCANVEIFLEATHHHMKVTERLCNDLVALRKHEFGDQATVFTKRGAKENGMMVKDK